MQLSESHIDQAQRMYLLALQNGFTSSRSAMMVSAACLYVTCRTYKTPHMLIDFSAELGINMFKLGNCFLQLRRRFHLDLPLVDPSFFINRFVSALQFGDKKGLVTATALRLVARMKRDSLHLGRRPAGVCGAAIFIAARMHGFERSKQEIVRTVHVHMSTIEKRLTEFSSTQAADLTVSEFQAGKEQDLPPEPAPALKASRIEAMRELDDALRDPMLQLVESGELAPDDIWVEEVREDDPVLEILRGQVCSEAQQKVKHVAWFAHEERVYQKRLNSRKRRDAQPQRRSRRAYGASSAAQAADNVLSARTPGLDRSQFVGFMSRDLPSYTHNGPSAASAPLASEAEAPAPAQLELDQELELEYEMEGDFEF